MRMGHTNGMNPASTHHPECPRSCRRRICAISHTGASNNPTNAELSTPRMADVTTASTMTATSDPASVRAYSPRGQRPDQSNMRCHMPACATTTLLSSATHFVGGSSSVGGKFTEPAPLTPDRSRVGRVASSAPHALQYLISSPSRLLLPHRLQYTNLSSLPVQRLPLAATVAPHPDRLRLERAVRSLKTPSLLAQADTPPTVLGYAI